MVLPFLPIAAGQSVFFIAGVYEHIDQRLSYGRSLSP